MRKGSQIQKIVTFLWFDDQAKDKYGLSWQIVPTVLDEMLQDEDAEKANRVMQAMLQMGKLEIAELKKAYAGR